MFEELKALILLRNPTMPESYLLESFIGGLKPAIKTLVRAFKPQTLDLAIEQARYQEEHIQALKLPPDRPYKTSYNSVNSNHCYLLHHQIRDLPNLPFLVRLWLAHQLLNP